MNATVTATLRINAETGKLVGEFRMAGQASKEFGTTVEDAGRRTAKSMREAGAATNFVRQQIDQVRGAALRYIGVGFAAILARDAVRAADSWSNMTAKLVLATGSAGAAAVAQEKLFAIAQRTSTAIDGNVTLYARLSAALKELKVSDEERLALTETINQAMVVSGASTAEQASAVLQLSQAFGAGRLSGEEFNAVNEAAPRLMQALADSLGVARGALKKMAEDGELTAEVMRRAFTGEQARQIADEFSKMPLTVARAWQQLENAVVRYIGRADQASGASRALAQSLQFLGEHIGEIIGLVTTLAQLLLANLAARALVAAAVAFRSLATSIALTLAPLAAFEVGAASAAVAAGGLTRALVLVRGAFAFLLTPVGIATTVILLLGKAMLDDMATAREYSAAVQSVADSTERLAQRQAELAQGGPLDFGVEELQADVDAARGALTSLDVQMGKVQERIAELAQEARNGIGGADTIASIGIQERKLGDLQAAYDALIRKVVDLGGALRDMAAARRAAEDAAEGVKQRRSAIDELIKSSEKRVNQLREEAEQLRGGEQALLAYKIAQLDMTVATEEQRAALERLKPEIAASEAAVKRLRDARKADAAATRDQGQAARELERINEEQRRQTVALIGLWWDEIDARKQAEAEIHEMDKALRQEEQLARLVGEARAELERTFRAEAIALQVVNRLEWESVEAMRAGYEAAKQVTEATLARTAADEKWAQESERVLNDIQSNNEQASEAVTRTWAEALLNMTDDWRDVGRRILDIAKQWLINLIVMFQRNPVQVQAQFNGAGGFGGMGGPGGTSPFNMGGMFAGAYGVGTNLSSFLMGRGFEAAPGFVGPPASMAGAGPGMAGYLGGGMGILGGLGVAYMGARTGNPLLGGAGGAIGASMIGGGLSAMGLAQAGAAVGGPIGLIVGAILGIIASQLMKEKPPSIDVIGRDLVGTHGYRNLAPGSTYQSGLGGFTFASIDSVDRAARDQLGQAVVDFDNTIASFLDNDQLGRVTDALADWQLRLKDSAITAENILGSRWDAILNTFPQDIQDVVRAAGDLEAQVAKLAETLLFPAEIRAILDAFKEEDMLAGMSETERQVHAINATFDEAAEALRARNATEADLTELEEYRTRTLQRLTAATEAQVQVERDLAGIRELIGGLAFEESLVGLSDAEVQIAQINRQFFGPGGFIAQATAMGASEWELGRIRQIGAERIRRIRDAEIRSQQDLEEAHRRSEEEYAASQLEIARRGIAQIRAFLLGEQFAATSTLTPQQRFEEAQRQYESFLRRARAGDLEAISLAQGAAERLLSEGSSYLGGGTDAYAALRDAVRQGLGGLAALDSPTNPLNRLSDVLTSLDQAIRTFTTYLGEYRAQPSGTAVPNAFNGVVAQRYSVAPAKVGFASNDPGTTTRVATGGRTTGDLYDKLTAIETRSGENAEAIRALARAVDNLNIQRGLARKVGS